MTPWLVLVYLLNFLAPAAVVGAGMTLAEWWWRRAVVHPRSLAVAWCIYFFVGLDALILGLLVWGLDGKLATYGVLLLAVGAVAAWRTRKPA